MINVSLPPPQNPEQQRLITSLYDSFRDVDLEFARSRQQTPQVAVAPMVAATGTAAALSWRNPHNQRIIITRFILDIEQGATAATIEVGTASTATALGNNLIDAASINATGTIGNITNAGAAGADCRRLESGFYITGTITGTVGSFMANAYIEYYFAQPVL